MSISEEQLAKHAAWLRDEDGGERLDLSGANLRWADLSGANLRGADLSGANLRWADLRWADLRWANLRAAHLRAANLRGADLRGADLREADLREADLTDVQGLVIAADSEQRLKEVASIILSGEGELLMSHWHSCETTHCLAGWAIHQAGEVGKILEANVGPHMAGMQLLGVEAASHFYDSTEDAMKWLESIA